MAIRHREHIEACHRPRAVFPALGLVLSLSSWIGCRPSESPPPSHSANPDASAFALIVDPDPIGMGALKPGETAQATLTLRNPGSEAVIVDHIETSCPCVRVAPVPTRIEPGRAEELVVRFDPSSEPDFRGRLGVDLIGIGAGGHVVLRTQVELEVSDGDTARESANAEESDFLEPALGGTVASGSPGNLDRGWD